MPHEESRRSRSGLSMQRLTAAGRAWLPDQEHHAPVRCGILGGFLIGVIGVLLPPVMFWGEFEINTLANPARRLPHIWPQVRTTLLPLQPPTLLHAVCWACRGGECGSRMLWMIQPYGACVTGAAGLRAKSGGHLGHGPVRGRGLLLVDVRAHRLCQAARHQHHRTVGCAACCALLHAPCSMHASRCSP